MDYSPSQKIEACEACGTMRNVSTAKECPICAQKLVKRADAPIREQMVYVASRYCRLCEEWMKPMKVQCAEGRWEKRCPQCEGLLHADGNRRVAKRKK